MQKVSKVSFTGGVVYTYYPKKPNVALDIRRQFVKNMFQKFSDVCHGQCYQYAARCSRMVNENVHVDYIDVEKKSFWHFFTRHTMFFTKGTKLQACAIHNKQDGLIKLYVTTLDKYDGLVEEICSDSAAGFMPYSMCGGIRELPHTREKIKTPRIVNENTLNDIAIKTSYMAKKVWEQINSSAKP